MRCVIVMIYCDRSEPWLDSHVLTVAVRSASTFSDEQLLNVLTKAQLDQNPYCVGFGSRLLLVRCRPHCSGYRSRLSVFWFWSQTTVLVLLWY